MIWVSGLFAHSVDQSVEGFARRIALAQDRADQSEATFEVRRRARDTHANTGPTAPTCSIVRTLGDTRTFVDVYELATEETLVGGNRRSRLHVRLFLVGSVLALHGTKLVNIFRQRGKSRRERRQILYAQVWSALLLASFVVLLGSLAATFAAGDIPWLPKWAEGLVLAVGALGIWKSKIFQGLADSGIVAASFVRYLDRPGGPTDRALRGQFIELLDRLKSLREPYDHVDVVAFSFGALAVINARFPKTDPPPDVVGSIDRFITLACPFDFVRAYWPMYFEQRFGGEQSDWNWINFYSPADVLSSNFADSEGALEATCGVQLEDYGNDFYSRPRNVLYRLDGLAESAKWSRSLMLDGFRLHGQYWEETQPGAETVFGSVAAELELSPVSSTE